MAIFMLKIRRPLGRLIFNMGIAIPGKIVFLIETPPSCRCEHTHVHSIVQNIESYFRLYRNIANDVIMERRVNSVEHLCDYTFPIPQTKTPMTWSWKKIILAEFVRNIVLWTL